ncbi:hypothetical protein T484DRAFT_1827429 [Baffinella frigidus]|nr:hypothetical protein T484DRAFT_1827429 [Cryptophyta sp. CCMP2293]
MKVGAAKDAALREVGEAKKEVTVLQAAAEANAAQLSQVGEAKKEVAVLQAAAEANAAQLSQVMNKWQETTKELATLKANATQLSFDMDASECEVEKLTKELEATNKDKLAVADELRESNVQKKVAEELCESTVQKKALQDEFDKLRAHAAALATKV